MQTFLLHGILLLLAEQLLLARLLHLSFLLLARLLQLPLLFLQASLLFHGTVLARRRRAIPGKSDAVVDRSRGIPQLPSIAQHARRYRSAPRHVE